MATADAAPARIARLHVAAPDLRSRGRAGRASRAGRQCGHGVRDVRGGNVRAMAMGRHGENGAGNGGNMVIWTGFRYFHMLSALK